MSYPSHRSMKLRGRKDHEEKLRQFTGAGETKVKHSPHRAEHDKLAAGGRAAYARGGATVEGGERKSRLDRPSRSKSSKGGGNKGSHVNIVIAHPQAAPRPTPVPVPVRPPVGGPPGMPPAMPPRPPIGPPVAGPPPVAGMGGLGGMGNIARPPGIKRGGAVYAKGGHVKMDDGAGGGEGRLEKIRKYGKNAKVGEPGVKGGNNE